MDKLILALLAGGAVLIIGFPKVRQALRIRVTGLLDNSTAPIEQLEDNYDQLIKQLPNQRRAVALTQASAKQTLQDLQAAKEKAAEIQERYQAALQMSASKDALETLEDQYADQQKTIAELETFGAEASQLAAEALKAFNNTTANLQRFKSRIEAEGRKAELTEAHRTANQVAAELGEINSSLSSAGKASRQIDLELEAARAEGKLGQGTTGEQELADLETKLRRDKARNTLRQKAGLSDQPDAH
ncbi:hypothetical protein BH10CYA1_BH10CYA1_64970 [soil metagenome]